jgi:hypothetical protein
MAMPHPPTLHHFPYSKHRPWRSPLKSEMYLTDSVWIPKVVPRKKSVNSDTATLKTILKNADRTKIANQT